MQTVCMLTNTTVTHSTPIEGNNSANKTKTLLHTSNMLRLVRMKMCVFEIVSQKGEKCPF